MSDTLLYVLIAIAALVVALFVIRAMRSGGGDRAEVVASPPAEPAPAAPESVPEAPLVSTPEPAAPPPSSAGEADELTQIKGLGPKAARGLAAIGVTRFAQIAEWTPTDIEANSTTLGDGFAERIERDRWVEQAGLLARGEIAAFEEKFGKLG